MSSSTVLVCDDAVFMRTMVSDILSQAGFTVVGEAENGKQAVEKYQQLKPDLVTMDIIMPNGASKASRITKMDPARILIAVNGQQARVQEAALGRRLASAVRRAGFSKRFSGAA